MSVLFGLIGKGIVYSFSKKYFRERFLNDHLKDYDFENFDIPEIKDFPLILQNNPNLAGLNVTVPYKETIIPFLNGLSKKAIAIGAVNVIRFKKSGTLKGYNSDYYGFKKSLKPLLLPHHRKALILGTGGSAKAVAFALEELDISYTFVSRQPRGNAIGYDRINTTSFDNYQIIINCTPVGTSPDVKNYPPIPYQFFTDKHLAYDLIYNPGETQFLKKAKRKGAVIKNGMEMLTLQAQKAWEIWNK